MSTQLLLIFSGIISTTMLIVDLFLTACARADREAKRADHAIRENDFLKISRDTWRTRALRAEANTPPRDFPGVSTCELEEAAFELDAMLDGQDETRWQRHVEWLGEVRARDLARDELRRVRRELERRRTAKVVFV